jgi:hypothetical protein
MNNRNIEHQVNGTNKGFVIENWDGQLLKRSIILACIIGSSLTLINQPFAVFGGQLFVKTQLILAFNLPFIVITLSQLLGKKQAKTDQIDNQYQFLSEGLLTTMINHNIPIRALIISVLAGSFANILILFIAYLEGENNNINVFLMIQPYFLTFIFGALSQALSYRRMFN